MEASLFLARLIGPVMLVIGLAVLANQRRFRELAEEFLASPALLFLSGLLIMPAGLAIVLAHNIWTADWQVLITLFGWLLTIGGAIRLIAPPFLLRSGRAMLAQSRFTSITAAIWTMLGLLFCFFGYLR